MYIVIISDHEQQGIESANTSIANIAHHDQTRSTTDHLG